MWLEPSFHGVNGTRGLFSRPKKIPIGLLRKIYLLPWVMGSC